MTLSLTDDKASTARRAASSYSFKRPTFSDDPNGDPHIKPQAPAYTPRQDPGAAPAAPPQTTRPMVDPRAASPTDTRPTTAVRTVAAPQPAQPQVPGNVITAANTLRNQTVMPSFTPQYQDQAAQLIQGVSGDIAASDLTKARAALDQLNALRPTLEGLMNQQVNAPTSYAPSDEAARMRQLLTGGVESLYNTPDRMGLMNEALSIYDQQSKPALDAAMRSVVQRAAAAGRTKSGMTTNRLTDVGTEWQQNRDLMGRTLLNEAVAATMADRLNRVGATQGAAGFISGDDLATAGFNQGLRQEQRGELDRRFGMGSSLAGLGQNLFQNELEMSQIPRAEQERDRAFGLDSALARSNALMGIDQATFGRGAAMRDEERVERGYQNQLALEAQAQRERQAEMEDRFQTSDTNRQLAWIESLIAQGMDPALIQALLQGGAA